MTAKSFFKTRGKRNKVSLQSVCERKTNWKEGFGRREQGMLSANPFDQRGKRDTPWGEGKKNRWRVGSKKRHVRLSEVKKGTWGGRTRRTPRPTWKFLHDTLSYLSSKRPIGRGEKGAKKWLQSSWLFRYRPNVEKRENIRRRGKKISLLLEGPFTSTEKPKGD